MGYCKACHDWVYLNSRDGCPQTGHYSNFIVDRRDIAAGQSPPDLEWTQEVEGTLYELTNPTW
ncbi:MAG: hypothetical protein U1E29_12770 [Coriobacteriia bacterium]|nr:hypothetical protein [Coriobacteriia bacterium]